MIIEKPIEQVDQGFKYTEQYYELANMYVTIGDRSVTISISDPKMQNRTAVGLCLVENLATLCLEEGVEKEIVAAVIWECSRDKGDLADRLSHLMTREHDAK